MIKKYSFASLLLLVVIGISAFFLFEKGDRNVTKVEVRPHEERVLTEILPKQSVPEDFTIQSPLIVIDPGHQRKADLSTEPVAPGTPEVKPKVTGGTQGVATGKPEYELVLEASLILGELLEERGFEVIYTRTENDVNISNIERANIANQNEAALFIRIHADGSENPNVHGFSILTPGESHEHYQASLQASQAIVAKVDELPDVKVNGIIYRNDLSGFNWSKVPVILIEMGFMTNPEEDKKLSTHTYLTNMMEKIAEGIQ